MDIKGATNGLANSFANNMSLSSSPELSRSPDFSKSFHSYQSSQGTRQRRDTNTGAKPLKPFATREIKILLLENVNTSGQDILRNQGYQVEASKASLPEAELIEKIRFVIILQRPMFSC